MMTLKRFTYKAWSGRTLDIIIKLFLWVSSKIQQKWQIKGCWAMIILRKRFTLLRYRSTTCRIRRCRSTLWWMYTSLARRKAARQMGDKKTRVLETTGRIVMAHILNRYLRDYRRLVFGARAIMWIFSCSRWCQVRKFLMKWRQQSLWLDKKIRRAVLMRLALCNNLSALKTIKEASQSVESPN